MTVLGVDYGLRRVGLAVSVDGQTPRRIGTMVNDDGFMDYLRQVIVNHGVQQIIVGLPRNLDGDDTQQSAVSRQFAGRAEQEFSLPVSLQDEADTSNLARERLHHEKSLSAEERKHLVDAEAAVIILEDFLGQHQSG
jgi:putative Holliday junction resolvase